jgi:hypothetical protein
MLILEGILLLLLLGVFLTYRYIEKKEIQKIETVSTRYRGTRSERRTILKLLDSNIHPKAIFHDLYLIKKSGQFTQIDLVVATPVGIIVFEVKEYNGWIFGNGNHRKWTQIMAYGRQKYYFYNPVLQNKKHIEDLKKQLPQFNTVPFFSVIVFFGKCSFRTLSNIPNEVFFIRSGQIQDTIRSILELNPQTEYKNKAEVYQLLKNAVLNGENEFIRSKHIDNVNKVSTL